MYVSSHTNINIYIYIYKKNVAVAFLVRNRRECAFMLHESKGRKKKKRTEVIDKKRFNLKVRVNINQVCTWEVIRQDCPE